MSAMVMVAATALQPAREFGCTAYTRKSHCSIPLANEAASFSDWLRASTPASVFLKLFFHRQSVVDLG